MPKILVIDDDLELRELISCVLEMEGHSVVLAEDGIAGIAIHRTEMPDLVITDMIMPGQGGVETIIQIREQTPDARIIAVSGGGEIDGMHPLTAARKLGVMETLHKPFTAAQLIDGVTSALGRVLVADNQHAPTIAGQWVNL